MAAKLPSAAQDRHRRLSRRAPSAGRRRACRGPMTLEQALAPFAAGAGRPSSGCPSPIRSTSCFRPARPACRNASSIGRRHAAAAPQGASAACRHRRRRPAVLLHHLRLDDVELAGLRRWPRAPRCCSTTARPSTRRQRAVRLRRRRGHDLSSAPRPNSSTPCARRACGPIDTHDSRLVSATIVLHRLAAVAGRLRLRL